MAVVGLGGVFFRAKDTKGLQAWYRDHLGVAPGGPFSWTQTAGAALFMPFAADTDYFPADRQWMINFRVEGLDGMIAALRAAGIEVTTNPEWDSAGMGKFARLLDPEGNQVELWEPAE